MPDQSRDSPAVLLEPEYHEVGVVQPSVRAIIPPTKPGKIQTGFMGLALGVAYLRLGRHLWFTILAHAYMDTILFVHMYLTG